MNRCFMKTNNFVIVDVVEKKVVGSYAHWETAVDEGRKMNIIGDLAVFARDTKKFIAFVEEDKAEIAAKLGE